MELFLVKRVVLVLVLWYETRRVWSWPPSHSKFDYRDPSGTKWSRISNWDRSKQSHSWGRLCNIALQFNSHSFVQFGHLAEDVKYLTSFFQSCSLSHVHRHCNVVTHSLARWAILCPHLLVWIEDVPLDIYNVLQAD